MITFAILVLIAPYFVLLAGIIQEQIDFYKTILVWIFVILELLLKKWLIKIGNAIHVKLHAKLVQEHQIIA